MARVRITFCVAVVAACLVARSAIGGTFTYSTVQSPARPYGLKLADKVAIGGTDARSKDFVLNELPTLDRLADRGFSDGGSVTAPFQTTRADGLTSIDPSSIRLAVSADVRVYFVMEHSSLSNSLGFNTKGGGVTSGDPLLVFPNSSTNASHVADYTKAKRETKAPLLPGDFVDLGIQGAGVNLDFFLIANGASGGKTVFSTQLSENPDKVPHAVAFAKAGSPYLYLGFNDRVNDDNKFEDLVLAIDIGAENVKALMTPMKGKASVPAPEPAGMLLVVGACAAWFCRRRAHRQE